MAARERSLNVGTVTAAGVVAAVCFRRPEQLPEAAAITSAQTGRG
jgi:hypothetical protein